jgi:hypothetical protein
MAGPCAAWRPALIWVGTLWVSVRATERDRAVLRIAGGVSHAVGCLIGAPVMTAYFVGGGLASAARVNAIQLAVKLAGFALATPVRSRRRAAGRMVTASRSGRARSLARQRRWPGDGPSCF